MNEVSFEEKRSSVTQEFKEQLDLYLFYRRYQKIMEGKLPWEEQIRVALTRAYTQVIIHWRSIFKRSIDLAVSALGIAVSLPVMALIAVAVRLDSNGPVFLRQTRVGKKGKAFTMLKFRTMRVDAEAVTGPVWATEHDPRITRAGNFLRKTHLDELPQFFNVFKGEMSLVGPRPERPYFVHEFRKLIPHYDRRLCVKPGITGLAQIRQGYDQTIEDVKRKVKYDFLYIQKMCPLLDIKLIAMTLGVVVARTGR